MYLYFPRAELELEKEAREEAEAHAALLTEQRELEGKRFSLSPLLSQHSFLVQAEGAGADQAGAGAAAGGGEASEEGRGAGEDDPGEDADRGVGEVTFFKTLLLTQSVEKARGVGAAAG